MRYLLCVLLILPTLLYAQIEAPLLNGEAITIPGADKKPSLLVFWASWCSSCNKEAPMIVKLNKELNGRIAVIGVNVDRTVDKAQPFIDKHGIDYPVLSDRELKVSKQFKVNSTPYLILLNPQGKEIHRSTHLNKEMVSHLRGLLRSAHSTVTVKKPKPRTQVLSRSPQHVIEQHSALMGTDVHILIHTKDRDQAQKAIAAAFKEFKRIEDGMTDWKPIGEVYKINQEASQRAVVVSAELFHLLEVAKEISQNTQGLFDISYKGVGSLWNFYAEPWVIPSKEQIEAGLKSVDYNSIKLDKSARSVSFAKSGMQIGLGGIAKGYAVDMAVNIIVDHGFKDFVVNAGGDLFVKASNNDALWRVGIRNPRNADSIIAEIPAKNYAIVTSGDYERFFVKDGKRYCHIINPKTGWPADACQSVTILAKSSMRADALATGVFLMGPENGIALVERLDDTEAFIVDAAGNVRMSSGFKQ